MKGDIKLLYSLQRVPSANLAKIMFTPFLRFIFVSPRNNDHLHCSRIILFHLLILYSISTFPFLFIMKYNCPFSTSLLSGLIGFVLTHLILYIHTNQILLKTILIKNYTIFKKLYKIFISIVRYLFKGITNYKIQYRHLLIILIFI